MLYGRISQDRSGEALGVSDQLKRAREKAQSLGWSIVDEYSDNDISALRGAPRAGYEALLADLTNGRADRIVAYHSGRLWRNRLERAHAIELFAKLRVVVASVKGPEFDFSTAGGRAIAGLLGEFDTMESEIKSERVAAAALRRAEAGLNHGGRRCYGYTADGLQLVPDEAAEVARAFDRFLNGVPLGAIVRDLNDRGVKTVSGRAWAPGTLRDTLRRARHAGLSEYKGEIVGVGQWPAIVDEQVWRAAVALLKDPSRRSSTGNRASYLLSGIARCGVCGGPITSAGVKKSGPGGGYRFMYRCRPAVGKSGNCVGRRRDWVDAYVTERVLERLSREDAVALLEDDTRPDMDVLRNEQHEIRTQLDDAAVSFARRAIDSRQLEIITKTLQKRLSEIDELTAHTTRAPVLRGLVEAGRQVGPSARLAAVEAAWEGLDLDRRRAVVTTLMDVVLHPGGGGRRTFDPTKVEIIPKQ